MLKTQARLETHKDRWFLFVCLLLTICLCLKTTFLITSVSQSLSKSIFHNLIDAFLLEFWKVLLSSWPTQQTSIIVSRTAK